jgi:hypothetical protein
MANFRFSTFNHCAQGKIIVEDITVTMGSQIAALGHKVTWTEEADFIPREEGWNVVLECFADDATIVAVPIVETLARAHAAGCRFLCVATEEPGEKGFNSALDPGMILRQSAFPAAAKYLDGILHLVPGESVTRWYSNFAPAAHAELGFAPGMVEESREEPHIDFGFYGLMTWRRREIIDAIAARTGKPVLEMTSLLTPRAARNAEMRQAKVILQIRANLETQWVSSTRCASALHMGRPVVAEPHAIRGPWDEIVPFSATIDEFYKMAQITAAFWRGAWRDQVDRFAAKLSPGTCVGRPLREIGAI